MRGVMLSIEGVCGFHSFHILVFTLVGGGVGTWSVQVSNDHRTADVAHNVARSVQAPRAEKFLDRARKSVQITRGKKIDHARKSV